MKSFAEFLMNKDNSSPSRFGKLSEAAPQQPQAGQAQAAAAQPQAGQAQQQAPGASETEQLLKYLADNKAAIKHYKKFAKVKARQSAGGEQVQTKLSGRDETDVRTTKPGDWVVSNIESQGEQQIVDDATFKKRYDVSNPKGDIFSPKNANFHGVQYTGPDISFAPPNWGGSKMNITTGYMIGGPDPSNFAKDFYGIDPKAFASTYKPADQVSESWMRGVFGVSPSKKNYDGINESLLGLVESAPAMPGKSMEFLVRDLSGRGFVATLDEKEVLSFKDEYEEEHGEEEGSFEDWVEMSDVGEEVRFGTISITRTK